MGRDKGTGWLDTLSISGKPLHELFRITATLMLAVPYGIIFYMMYEDGFLHVLWKESDIALLGFGIIIILSVLAMLHGMFDSLSALATTMSEAGDGDLPTRDFSREARELQEISRSFRSLLGRNDEVARELAGLSQKFIVMKELGDAVTRKLEMPELLNILLDRAMQVTRAQIGSVFLVDEYSYQILAVRGVTVGADAIAIRESIVARVASDKKPLLVTGIGHDPVIYHPDGPKDGTPSFLAMPVMLGETLLAVVNLTDKQGGAVFHEDDVATLTTMINQVQVALENAHVHHAVRQHMLDLEEQTHQLNLEISRRKKIEKELAALALQDALTDLANRRQFLGLLEQAIAQSRRHQEQLAVLFLDMDHFKVINDSMGHSVGDLILQEAARRMRGSLREADVVARYGGDEFTCILTGVHHQEDVRTVTNKLLETLSKPFALHGQEYYIGSSIGVCLYPEGGDLAEDLIKHADAAMYDAKESGGQCCRFYTPALGDAAHHRVQLEIALRQAVHNDEFVLHYQPQVDLRDGHLSGIEALLRWRHPERGLLGPNEFVPLAEQTGLILPIGRWVLTEACRQFKQWHDQGWGGAANATLNAAINISGQQFRQGDFVRELARVLEQTGVDPQLLELEITESIVMDAGDHITKMLYEIKDMGVRLAIDDFGSGFSSLSYLKHFPIDTLKIDKEFVRNLPGDRDDVAIVHAILELAFSLDMQVVAEGVENVEQLQLLRRSGCHAAQGFLLGYPVGADELMHIISDEKTRDHWLRLWDSETVPTGG